MYAIVEVGGRQHMMEPKKVVKVDRRPQETGEEIKLAKVLAIKDSNGELHVGRPYLDDATVTARVVEQGRERKITVVKFKAKKHYRRKVGHRQHFTALEILSIDSDSAVIEVEETEVAPEPQEPEMEAAEVTEEQTEAEEPEAQEAEVAEEQAEVEEAEDAEEPETEDTASETGDEN